MAIVAVWQKRAKAREYNYVINEIKNKYRTDFAILLNQAQGTEHLMKKHVKVQNIHKYCDNDKNNVIVILYF